MPDVLPDLIDAPAGFEIVRDQIASILVENQAAQVALATAAAKPNPEEWAMRVYVERAKPWEAFLNRPVSDESPILNVRYDSGTFDRARGNTVNRQTHSGIFDIEVLGFGVTKDNGAGGQDPGDEKAAFTVQRGVRFVKDILMAAQNVNLQLPIVGNRWIQSINAFLPGQPSDEAQSISGVRVAVAVDFNEFSPQATGTPLEEIALDIKRDSDGMVVAQVEYDFTP